MGLIRRLLDPWSAKSIATRMGYCPACTAMLCTSQGITAMRDLPGYRHHNKHECEESARRGCPLCKVILRQAWENRDRHVMGGNSPYTSGLIDENNSQALWFISRGHGYKEFSPGGTRYRDLSTTRALAGSSQLSWLEGGWISYREDTPYFWANRISIAVMASHDDPAAKHYLYRPRYDHFLDARIMDDASKWLNDCINGRHKRCVHPGDAALPTRVLDVGPAGPGLDPTVRLLQTKPDDTAAYVALSYCWGGPQPLTATKSNILGLMAGADIQKMPQTLQDAVYVTRRLGFRYLWIDALCIIQDSPEDKASEIEKMGSIYRNAVVTIAATHSRKASDGFLSLPNLPKEPDSSCVMPVYLPDRAKGGRVTLAARQNVTLRHVEPLRTRGWAFQEAVLSRRILIFSEHHLHGHCHEIHGVSLNVGNLGIAHSAGTRNLFAFGVKHFDHFELNLKNHGPGWMKARYLADIWTDMLDDFTSRSLTVPDDRLHALKGIANELLQSNHLSPDMDRTYVAGVWIACLPAQLLWSRHSNPALCPDNHFVPAQKVTARSNRGPSWSWACLDCPIKFLNLDSAEEYKGFSVLKSPSGSNPAQLEVECDMLSRSVDEFRDDSTKSDDIRFDPDLDVDELGPGTRFVQYILLHKFVSPGNWDDGEPLFFYFVLGIVVYETPDGCFRRLGSFRWEVGQPAEEEYSFGQRRRVTLV